MYSKSPHCLSFNSQQGPPLSGLSGFCIHETQINITPPRDSSDLQPGGGERGIETNDSFPHDVLFDVSLEFQSLEP